VNDGAILQEQVAKINRVEILAFVIKPAKEARVTKKRRKGNREGREGEKKRFVTNLQNTAGVKIQSALKRRKNRKRSSRRKKGEEKIASNVL
jgi:hypothetical protein